MDAVQTEACLCFNENRNTLIKQNTAQFITPDSFLESHARHNIYNYWQALFEYRPKSHWKWRIKEAINILLKL